MGEIRALIFDCDGTLADTMPPHYEAWVATLARYQLTLDEDRFYAMGGWPTQKVSELIVFESGRPIDATALAQEKEHVFEGLLHTVTEIEPVASIARQYRGKLPMAVATGGTRVICEQILRHTGLFSLFDAVVCCEDVRRHKPEPDIFLEAARRLGVPPAECRVYEDTNPGLESARRAGMPAVDIRQFHSPRRVTMA